MNVEFSIDGKNRFLRFEKDGTVITFNTDTDNELKIRIRAEYDDSSEYKIFNIDKSDTKIYSYFNELYNSLAEHREFSMEEKRDYNSAYDITKNLERYNPNPLAKDGVIHLISMCKRFDVSPKFTMYPTDTGYELRIDRGKNYFPIINYSQAFIVKIILDKALYYPYKLSFLHFVEELTNYLANKSIDSETDEHQITFDEYMEYVKKNK